MGTTYLFSISLIAGLLFTNKQLQMKYLGSTTFQFQLLFQLAAIILFQFIDLNTLTQALICGIALCIIGIPHGANDYLYRNDQSNAGLIKFLIRYVGIMALYLMVWWLVPVFALSIFFIISLHHFGQSNFENQQVWHIPSLLWGIWTLLLPVLLHYNEAILIFKSMVSFNVYGGDLISQPIKFGIWQGVIMFIFSSIYIVSLFIYERKNIIPYTIQFVLVTIWFTLTPLLFGFIIVFCLWHSIQSLQHQATYFKEVFSKSTRAFLYAMLPFSVIALFFFCMYVVLFDFNISISFVLLSLISLPHVIVMHQLYNNDARSFA
jgi:Brp/Blh family beta-carotene 15,15'-monooxygenase